MRIEKPKRKKSGKKKTPKAPASAAGKTPGKTDKDKNTVRLNVNVPRETYRQLRIKAAEKETSVSRAVIGLIENYVTRR